jgi:hypothetical protein
MGSQRLLLGGETIFHPEDILTIISQIIGADGGETDLGNEPDNTSEEDGLHGNQYLKPVKAPPLLRNDKTETEA